MSLWKSIKSFFTLPSYEGWMSLGFVASTRFQEFTLIKKSSFGTLRFHQEIEPHHPDYAQHITFDHEGPCLVFEPRDFQINFVPLRASLRAEFDYTYENGPYVFFLMDKKGFNDKCWEEKARTLIEYLKSS